MRSHTPVSIPGKEATCTATGLTEGSKCSVCGTVLTAQKVIAKLPHTPEVIHGIYPMCFRDGWTDGSVCSVCGEILEPCQVIPALPHTRGGLAEVKPTCSSFGWTEGIACQICSHVMVPQRKIPKLPHTPVVLPAVAPTCTKTGLTEGSVCSVCGEIVKAQAVIPATGHTPGPQVKEFNTEAPELDAAGNLLKDETHHPYCYALVSRCTQCGEICDIQYCAHTNGATTFSSVSTEDACQKAQVHCADCSHVIRWYITSHEAAPAVEILDEENVAWTVIKCSKCGFLISKNPT